MIDRSILADYMDGVLGPAERSAIERRLEEDPPSFEGLVGQYRADRLLRSLLAPAHRTLAIRESIMVAIGEPPLASVKERVLKEISGERRARRWRLYWAWGFGVALTALVISLAILRPDRREGPTLAEVSGGVTVSRDGVEIKAHHGAGLMEGDWVRLEAGASATLRIPGGTRLRLAGRSDVRLETDDGARLSLSLGQLSADVAKRGEGKPLMITTPLAAVRVMGTKFDLRAAEGQTRLEVREGLVRVDHGRVASAVEVAAGEFALAVPRAEIIAGLLAAPFDRAGKSGSGGGSAVRPFSDASPWNRPIDAAAGYDAIESPSLDLAGHGAVVLPASRSRPIWVVRPDDPERRIVLRYEGRVAETVRAPTVGDRMMDGTLIDPARGVAYELVQVVRRGEDLEAMVCQRLDLGGPGIPPEQPGHTRSGLPLIAGIIREGELETGIRHALAVAALHQGLNRRAGNGEPFVWPARHMPIELHKLESMGDSGNVCYGTRLALPRDLDLASLGVKGPALEIARALQTYGAFVTHSFPAAPNGDSGGWRQPHLQFFADLPMDCDFQKLAAEVSRIVPHLGIVTGVSQ